MIFEEGVSMNKNRNGKLERVTIKLCSQHFRIAERKLKKGMKLIFKQYWVANETTF